MIYWVHFFCCLLWLLSGVHVCFFCKHIKEKDSFPSHSLSLCTTYLYTLSLPFFLPFNIHHTYTHSKTLQTTDFPENIKMADKEKPEKGEKGEKGKKADRRRRVAKACVYCHRSHLMCDADRPCSRCRKRNIAHLCRDEEDDLHVLFRKLRSEIGQFHQGLRMQREREGIPARPASTLSPSGTESGMEQGMGDSDHGGNDLRREDMSNGGSAPGGHGPDGPMPGMNLGGANSRKQAGLIDEWVCGGFGINTAELNAAADPPNLAESFGGVDNARLVAFTEKIQHQAMEMNPDQATAVLSANSLLRYYQGALNLHEYIKVRVSREQLDDIEAALVPFRNEFMETLLTLDYKDLVTITQSFERLLLSARKYMTILTLPGMVVRRSGQIATVSDQLAHILGYTREELLRNRYIHEFLPDKDLHAFYTGPGIQCYRSGGTQACVCDLNLVRKNGAILRTRASLSLQRCPTNHVPLGVIVIMFPLEPPHPQLSQPESEVLPSTYISPAEAQRLRDMMVSRAHHPLISVEDLQQVMNL
eukprot:comp21274_c1_seq1/m.29025 comp21274_c1_seq1/g.29025  ORF comp21274_c1_seq1/g.29025 comp21274_c1_seq1/m.29025 type:complete len:532 (-) comp21274_c1_seq1:278-1873(-)